MEVGVKRSVSEEVKLYFFPTLLVFVVAQGMSSS